MSYNSCRNRHCPKCQANAAKRWLQARQADLLLVGYYHVVSTLPAPISDIVYDNKAVVYGLLFEIAAETLTTGCGCSYAYFGAASCCMCCPRASTASATSA